MILKTHNRLFKIVGIYIVLCFHHHAIAQDPQFSQFFSSPLTLNPALTGNFNGTMRAVTNIRSQNTDYANAYNTKTASVDFHMLHNKIKQEDQLSAGIILLSDQRGNKVFTENNFGLSLAYRKALDDEQIRSITFGFQTIFSSKRFNPSYGRLEDQLTPGGFNGLTNDIVLSRNLSRSSIDINTGMLYQYTPTTENHYYIGISVFNLLGSRKSFGDNSPTAIRKSVHGGTYMPLGVNGTLHGSFHFQQQNANNQLLIGGAYSHFIKDVLRSYVEMYWGAWYRTNKTVIPYMGIEYNYWRIGYTYDVALNNQLPSVQSRYSHEISLYYPLNRDKSLLKYKCLVF